MQDKNRIREPFFIFIISLFLLFIISFIKVDYQIGDFRIHTVDLLYDIKADEPEEEILLDGEDYHSSGRKDNLKAGLDISVIIEKLNEILESKKDNLTYNSPLPAQGVKTPITGNIKQLSYFFDALKNAKSKGVRIAHYGDSAIEGDLITADIREGLQSRFGGNGVGWLGIVTQDITFRTTTKHSFSDNWETAALYSNNPKGLPLGLSGEISIPKGNAWVQYETTRARRSLRDFSIVKLYYSNAKNSQ